MTKLSIALLICTVALAVVLERVCVHAEDENSFEQARAKSNEFLRRKRGIFHPGVTACEEQKREAREDYDSAYANRFLKRTFFHPGATKCEEQKREAREDYEERCEPSFPLFRNTGTRRYCPDIHNWKALDDYEIGGGFETRDPISGHKPSVHRNYDRQQFNRNEAVDESVTASSTAVPTVSNDYDAEDVE